jgi:hypothetical protein
VAHEFAAAGETGLNPKLANEFDRIEMRFAAVNGQVEFNRLAVLTGPADTPHSYVRSDSSRECLRASRLPITSSAGA